MGLSLPHLIILLIVLPLTFAPTIVAFVRKHPYQWVILAINVLLGWTGVAWIGALIWAIVGKPKVENPSENFQ
jgi:ABC-type transport system involved in cytochrome c biogenesis permease component